METVLIVIHLMVVLALVACDAGEVFEPRTDAPLEADAAVAEEAGLEIVALDDTLLASAVFRGAFPVKAPMNLAALKVQLRDNANRGSGTRGLIADDGTKAASKINSVPFEENPTPVMAATIRYYKP